MFAYCLNNPLVFKDDFGDLPIPIIFTINEDGVQDFAGVLGPYNELIKLTRGNPLYEVHHLVEKRFYAVPGVGVYEDNQNRAPSVILLKQTHRGYTKDARAAFRYGINYHDKTSISVDTIKAFYENEYGGKNDWLDYMASCFE